MKIKHTHSMHTGPGSLPGIPASQLTKLFENGLRDMYWAEKALTRAIPKMIKNASSDDLVEVLENHLDETREQVSRAEQVFETIGKKAVGKKCEAMKGLIKEGSESMTDCEAGAMCDAGIIASTQKIEHYEIASYGTLKQFAETLGYTDAADLLETSLREEKKADGKLTNLALQVIDVPLERQAGLF